MIDSDIVSLIVSSRLPSRFFLRFRLLLRDLVVLRLSDSSSSDDSDAACIRLDFSRRRDDFFLRLRSLSFLRSLFELPLPTRSPRGSL